jgi:hypothetical protein
VLELAILLRELPILLLSGQPVADPGEELVSVALTIGAAAQQVALPTATVGRP